MKPPHHHERRRTGRGFRATLLEFARTMVWVAPLTLLIWIYAEREQKATVDNVRVRVEVQSENPQRVVKIVQPSDRLMTLTLEGPRARVDAVRSQLAGGDRAQPLIVVLDGTVPLGRTALRAAARLSESQLLSENGVVVRLATPIDLEVDVDELATTEAVIKAAPATTNLEGTPVFTPATVMLTGPSGLLAQLTERDESGRPIVYGALDTIPALRQPTAATGGSLDIPDVALRLPREDPQLRIDRATVAARVTVRAADARFEIPSIPVFPLASMKLLDDYRAEFPPTLTNVSVTGPADRIEALRRNWQTTANLRAVLSISRDDLPEGQVRRRKLLYMLPEGITATPEQQAKEVEFTLTSRLPIPQ
jgi:hypothetical protein